MVCAVAIVGSKSMIISRRFRVTEGLKTRTWRAFIPNLSLDSKALLVLLLIVSCNNDLGPNYLGKIIDSELIDVFESMGVDACGENGEFHTLVVNAPFFKNRIHVEVEEKVVSSNYNFANSK